MAILNKGWPERWRGRIYRRELLMPTALFLITRVALLVLARYSQQAIRVPGPNPSLLPRSDLLAQQWAWTSPWFRFDTGWYVGIAQHGYHWGALGEANTNFMPLYPLLVRGLTLLTLGSPWLAAWLIANIAALAAMILLWIWGARRWGKQIADRCVLLVALFPFAFFLMAPYAEPLFLALTLTTFIFAERGHWSAATVTAGLCTVTRPVGTAVVLGLVIMAWRQLGPRKAALCGLGMVPLLVFCAYLAVRFGHPLGFLTYHSAGWQPARAGIRSTLAEQFDTYLSPFDRVDAALAALFLCSVPVVWRRVGPAYAVYTAVGVALPLVHGLVSIERYVTVLFPVMASWSGLSRKSVQLTILATSLLGLLLSTALFAAGYSIF